MRVIWSSDLQLGRCFQYGLGLLKRLTHGAAAGSVLEHYVQVTICYSIALMCIADGKRLRKQHVFMYSVRGTRVLIINC